MGDMYQQNDDGSWVPATPVGWQGEGVDWETYGRVGLGYSAEAFDKDVWLTTIEAKTKLGLRFKMWRTERRWGWKRNSVF